jgi:hypothetical protein
MSFFKDIKKAFCHLQPSKRRHKDNKKTSRNQNPSITTVTTEVTHTRTAREDTVRWINTLSTIEETDYRTSLPHLDFEPLDFDVSTAARNGGNEEGLSALNLAGDSSMEPKA